MAFRVFRKRRPVPKRIKSVFGRGGPSLTPSGVKYTWNGERVIGAINAGALRAMKRAEDDAREYWNEVAWAPALHPYATGAEQEAGQFTATPNERNTVRLTGAVTLGEEYPIYHEFGTANYEGHFPLRQTMDFIAPRIRAYLAAELSQVGGR